MYEDTLSFAKECIENLGEKTLLLLGLFGYIAIIIF